jgi:hypothetical protein
VRHKKKDRPQKDRSFTFDFNLVDQSFLLAAAAA